MNIERAELLVTLKCGHKVWKKGTIFDPKKDGHPIPSEIIAEVRANTRTVRVLQALTAPVTATTDEEETTELTGDEEEEETTELTGDEEEETAELTGKDVLRMNHEQILDLLKNEDDFESLKDQKRTALVGIARKRFVKK